MSSSEKFSCLKDPPGAFPVWESLLVGRFGVGRDRLLELREALLVEGVDWIKNGRRVCLNSEAVEKVAHGLGLNGEKRAGGPPAVLPEPLPKPVFTLRVFKKAVSHPHLVLATDGTAIYRVRVKTKENFIPGMEIRCAHDTLDLFDHVGNCPRYRGKY